MTVHSDIRKAFPPSRTAADALALYLNELDFEELEEAQAKADAESLKRNAAKLRALTAWTQRESVGMARSMSWPDGD